MKKSIILIVYLSIAFFVVFFGFFFGSTGIVRDDLSRNIIIPDKVLYSIRP